MAEFTMPSLGADMDEGTLQEWLVRAGDRVRKGDAVAVVETAKSTIEVECFETGTVGKLLVDPGTTVPVGAALALIEPAGEPGAPKEREKPDKPKKRRRGDEARPEEREAQERRPAAQPAPGPAKEPVPAPAGVNDGVRGDEGPLIRHLAEQAGVDLDAVHGSGPGKRVTRADVERAAAARRLPARITPLARRLAGELGVDLSGVTGTGRDGAVRAADVRQAAPGPTAPAEQESSGAAAASPSAERRPAGMREAIAGLMARANREIPHYYLSTTVDLTAAMDWMHEYNRHCPPGARLLPAALLLKAAARAAREVPALNGFWTDDGFSAGRGVHLGVAVSLRGGGLVAPALHDADTLELPQLMAGLKDLVHRARTGRLRGSEVSDATITVTNLGDQGVESVLGVIYPPQVALVGFGRVVERPWAVDGLLGVRPVVTATLSADHRATDGAVGARYLTAVDRFLQSPEEI
ncbi:2-oxo acid dehydrogenase subunit E2 [Streptomyces sioyaensis]|uniref:Dihydrolipoamide acetyltransferase component of pyruvate dehydrogenase complex n=1 Tax=Streptomyces sioyaensis TaxID=67364 RepID=A0A4Q1RCN8_9ACTN|nr:2-oxo acid dehydrogenase subunit E2 [Streptomyces sioyaensis]MBM4796691.1 2-oxo acid dehydrogenase subunit E2 [Streptomyces sioyaensis]RXS71560.1 2-oxo acid dehydrogenase subunit E2 [Streptomyces sioyaensis]